MTNEIKHEGFTPLTITRERLTDYKGKHAYNVLVDGAFVGAYEGEIDLNNEVEKRAALFADAPRLLAENEALKVENNRLNAAYREMGDNLRHWLNVHANNLAVKEKVEASQAELLAALKGLSSMFFLLQRGRHFDPVEEPAYRTAQAAIANASKIDNGG